MKRILLFLLGCVSMFLSIGAYAESYRGCYIIYNNGSRALIDLWPEMQAACTKSEDTLDFGHPEYDENGNACFVTHFSVKADRFEGLEMTDETNSVETLKADIRLRTTSDSLYIYGAEQGTSASVYSADGFLMRTVSLAGDDVVSLAGMPAGLYLITINGLTCKFLKK